MHFFCTNVIGPLKAEIQVMGQPFRSEKKLGIQKEGKSFWYQKLFVP